MVAPKISDRHVSGGHAQTENHEMFVAGRPVTVVWLQIIAAGVTQSAKKQSGLH
jgi:hypothetical protein